MNMGMYQWILIVLILVGLVSSETKTSWDIPFQLNRKYGLTAITSDLTFPMEIKSPGDGELYSVPAQTFFNDKQLPDTSVYMQLNFQPNLTLNEFYFLAIRDPDGVLRFSLSMYKRITYRVQLRYNLLDSIEGEQTIEFPYSQSQSYWRLGVWIKKDSIDFFTNCPQMQLAPFHETHNIKLLGRPLFREGASAFMLNSGIQSNPMYFQGILTEFTFHTGEDATKAPCKTIEPKQESGDSILDFDLGFGNVVVEDDDDTYTTTTEEISTTTSTPNPTTTTTSEEITSASAPDLILSTDDKDVAITEAPSNKISPSISTIISFTSDSWDKENKGYLIPILDISDMTIRLLNTIENRVVENARLENGFLQFENGTSILIEDARGISPPGKTTTNVMISVDLDEGTTQLFDLSTGDVIMTRKSSDGIPPEIMKKYSEGAQFEIMSGNTIIQVDTFNGGWTVQDASTGEIHVVQEVKDGIIYLANGDEIQLPNTGDDTEVISIDAINGIVRAVNKETGEARIIHPPAEESESATDNTKFDDKEEITTSTTDESTPEIESTTEQPMEITGTSEVSDGSEIAKEESSSSPSEETGTLDESITTSTSSSETDPFEAQSEITTASPTSTDANISTILETTEALSSSSVTETTSGQDEGIYNASIGKSDTTECVTSVDEQDMTTPTYEVSIPATEDSLSVSGSEDMEAKTTSAPDRDDEDSSTIDPNKISSSSTDYANTSDLFYTPSGSLSPDSATKSTEVSSELSTLASTTITNDDKSDGEEEVGEQRSHRSVATQVDEGLMTEFPFENQPTEEILQPDCACIERLLTPEVVEKIRESSVENLDTKDKIYDELFRSPAFLRVVQEVIDEYFERPGIPERYKPNCNCPVNNGCSCPSPEPPPPYNVSSSSQHILGALKDMSNGAIIMNNKTTLTKIASSLAPGSMVYLNAEDMFYLKVDEKENIWRTIDMNTQSESVRIPEPKPITTTTAKPSLADHLIGRSLMLIGHNEALNGQLRFGAKLSGGHSGAIFACQRAARRHNISHIFYPLMNTDMFNMDYVVPPFYRYDMPIINLKGEIIFDDFMHMINGEQAPMAPIYSFAGKELDSDPTVPCAWVGAKPIYLNGDYEFAAQAKCRNWQSREATQTGLAVHIPMSSNATAFFDQSNLYNESCAKRCSILCIQISPN